jgi:hypothetical protein
MPCIKRDPINALNFLRWCEAADFFLQDDFELPIPYCAPDGIIAAARPKEPTRKDQIVRMPLVPGDEISFFINSAAAIVVADPETLLLGLVRDGLLVWYADALNFIVDPATPSGYRIHSTFTVPELPDGAYNLVIIDNAARDRVLLIANSVEIVAFQDWQTETVKVKFRHKTDRDGIPYSTMPGFYQEFRLALSMYQPKFPTDTDEYTDRNNRTRTTRERLSAVYEIQSDFWDMPQYRAAAMMFSHSDLRIDGTAVRLSGSLDPEYSDGSNIVTVKGKVSDQDFARMVEQC